MAKQTKSVDLGALQVEMENAAKSLKSAQTTYNKAKEALDRADSHYISTKNALAAGVEQLKAATKIG